MSKLINKIFAGATAITLSVMLFGSGIAPVRATMTADQIATAIADLQQQLLQYQAMLNDLGGSTTPTVPSSYEGIPDGFTFTNPLYYGMSGDEVKYLQIILKSEIGAPTYPATVGATGWFGPVSKASVIAFQEKYADDILASWGLTHGTGYVGKTTRDKLNELLAGSTTPEPPAPSASDFDNESDCTDANYFWYNEVCNELAEGEEPVGETGDLTVSLASDNPISTTILEDSSGTTAGAQSLVPFVSVDFTNSGDGDATVTSLAFTRLGIASDVDLSQLYIYDGDDQLAEYSSFNDKVVTFVNSAGLFTVPAGETKTVTLKADVANGTSASKTIGFKIATDTDVVSDATSVGGDFPVSGNLMSTAQVTDLGQLTVATNSYNSSPNPGETDYELWEFKLTATDQKMEVRKLVFTNVGSTDDNDLQNLKE